MFIHKVMTPFFGNAINLNRFYYRSLITGPSYSQRVLEGTCTTKDEEQWINAKDYEAIPGPTQFEIFRDLLPGGQLHKANIIKMNKVLRERYGDIYRLKGFGVKPDTVFTNNPIDFKQTYRNEGIWSIRTGLQTFTYYRKKKRPDVFHKIGGLVLEQGKHWADIRNKVSPVLMKVQNIRRNLPAVGEISPEFQAKMEKLRHVGTLTTEFYDQLKIKVFESMNCIALKTRMASTSDKTDPNARRLDKHLSDFIQFCYQYDVQPSITSIKKYIESPGFKRLIKTYDGITEITINYINEAIKSFEAQGNKEAKSVLEQLCRIDKRVAITLAMLMAGIDTTFITLLYLIAKNRDKQQALRNELKITMTHKDTPLTEQNIKNMTYVCACIKEAFRITPITSSNYRITTMNLVLSGYKVPAGTGILNVTALSNAEKDFPRIDEFLPELRMLLLICLLVLDHAPALANELLKRIE